MNVKERRTIEALRAGVPNRDAVSQLGTDQKTIERRVVDALSQIGAESRKGRQLPGFLISGDFGSGKSHLLEWLQHVALDQRFACSKVVISKESPLSHPHRVFRTAMHSLKVPSVVGGIEEVALHLDPNTQSYAEMYMRVQDPKMSFDPLFQSTLWLHEKVKDEETRNQIVSFWRGERLDLGWLRRTLRSLGAPPAVIKKRRIADLALPRFRFAAELLAGAGYAGWVVLLDELELIASFSLQARARSYATLASLLGLVTDEGLPGLFVVGTVTPDFSTEVFATRHDDEKIPQRLSDKLSGLMPAITAGMDVLRSSKDRRLDVEPQTRAMLTRTHEKVRQLYSAAYDWVPPDGEPELHEGSRRMRQYVRQWITQWDLTRLDPKYQPDIQTENYTPDLAERPDLERSVEPDEDDKDPD